MAKILVTGGLGLIGSAVCKRLIDRGEDVIALDNSTAYFNLLHDNASIYQRYLFDRLSPLRNKLTFVRGDTRHKDEIRRIINDHQPTHIIHLAAMPLANISQTHSEEAFGSIVSGTTNLLEVIRDNKSCVRFVYASSSMVYGEFMQSKIDETHPKHPKNIYGGAKLCGEVITQTYGNTFDIEYSIVRPTAVYGPTDVNRRVVQIFCENALMGKTLILKGGASNPLDFTYTDDIVDGFIRAALEPRGANEIFNISRGESRTLGDLVSILKDQLGDINVIEEPMEKNIPRRGSLNISKAKRMLDFDPTFSLEKGVSEYLKFLTPYFQK
jgi:nucleoside-diphosphate-sugar epimerase